MFSLRKRTGSLKVLASADLQYFAQNQAKSKKKVPRRTNYFLLKRRTYGKPILIVL